MVENRLRPGNRSLHLDFGNPFREAPSSVAAAFEPIAVASRRDDPRPGRQLVDAQETARCRRPVAVEVDPQPADDMLVPRGRGAAVFADEARERVAPGIDEVGALAPGAADRARDQPLAITQDIARVGRKQVQPLVGLALVDAMAVIGDHPRDGLVIEQRAQVIRHHRVSRCCLENGLSASKRAVRTFSTQAGSVSSARPTATRS